MIYKDIILLYIYIYKLVNSLINKYNINHNVFKLVLSFHARKLVNLVNLVQIGFLLVFVSLRAQVLKKPKKCYFVIVLYNQSLSVL